MTSYVTKYRPEQQFTTAEQCAINELCNHDKDSACSIARAVVAPGVCTQLHAVDNTIERYVILSGQGEVFIRHGPAESVMPLDIVTIPAGVAQQIKNTTQQALVFLCICTPRFEQKNYRNLEISGIEK